MSNYCKNNKGLFVRIVCPRPMRVAADNDEAREDPLYGVTISDDSIAVALKEYNKLGKTRATIYRYWDPEWRRRRLGELIDHFKGIANA